MKKFDRDLGCKGRCTNANIISAREMSAENCPDEIAIASPATTRLYWEAIVRRAFMSAAMVFSIAAVAHAGELSDTKTQSEQLREQNQLLTKKLADLEQRLHKLESQLGKQPVSATQLPSRANSTAGDYKKAPSLVADDGSLTYRGITLYGAIDTGLAYQTHGTP